jgi:hypothetical protein
MLLIRRTTLLHLPGMEDKNSGFDLPPVEATIPPGKANKPFWAHGIDLLGYSLGSRRHALLPFHDSESPRRTGLIRSSLSFDHTQALLQVEFQHLMSFSCSILFVIFENDLVLTFANGCSSAFNAFRTLSCSDSSLSGNSIHLE